MDKITHFKNIMERRSDRCGFWHGFPHGESRPRLFEYFGVKDDFELGEKLGDTFMVLFDGGGEYNHPARGNNAFDIQSGGVPRFSELTDDDIGSLEDYDWPDAKHVDFSRFAEASRPARESMTPVLSGSWACFFHTVAGLFGMEDYFMKMHTDPNLVLEVTERVVKFYTGMNDKLYAEHGSGFHALFYGNDYGTQLDMIISPAMFRKFVMPYQKKISDQAKSYGMYSVLHSCGAVSKAIPDMIDAGIDALHPIQALAAGMDAESLAEKFKDKIVFIGGVDTQVLLREGSAAQIKNEVRRLKKILGNNFIVSPSHEAVLPDVPPQNIAAMAEAAAE